MYGRPEIDLSALADKIASRLAKTIFKTEQLITTEQLIKKLVISRDTFERIRPSLIAGGLPEVKIAGTAGRPIIRYRESAVDAELLHASREGRPAWLPRKRQNLPREPKL